MRIKRIVTALVVVAALGASAAQATNVAGASPAQSTTTTAADDFGRISNK
ncbi:hypothetical protein [Deinococcus hopiensis]|uniref:Uncharacterized protein n=1 Tax=Deinococcus hopiensis KR-140 TaxID=695939 RepID=A0A1W1VNY8_9DEIO|nr:hypothetical protein [Deinococcus hopiensis]SMB95092.1 hypothetical protein SAMN00790413_02684 [Deinococcus hopiensis KR-140]